ncbi:MAG TPA: efflux RND transporter periplasmic adaptor subunit [Gemmatimonadales bacterium]|jgi:membrane fusion protein, multidrug efflux system|nr:efflux RND transporter periplasmic adaptor subunit [Gemmatimonadales bacterium]
MRVAETRPLAALLILGTISGCKEPPPPPPPPPEVVVQPVDVRDTPVQAEFTGEIRGGEDVEVRARVAGYLQAQDYDEGTVVRKGQLLFLIDPKPFEATVARARADVAEAAARHSRAEIQVNRLRPLVADNAVSQQDLDNAVASEEASRASQAAAEAQLTSALLDLGYTRVTSPITGLAGNRQQDVGSYVGSPQPTVLTVVSSLDPVRFDFTISEAEYLAYARATQAKAGKRSGPGPELELVLADGSTYPAKGKITVVGRGVDAETGTLPLQATFPNPDGLLRPGQFGRVRLPVTTRKNAILIPQRAVQELQGTYNVFVVGNDSIAQIRAIKPGNRVGSDWVITDGLEPADRIVVEGLQKVRDGVKVRPTAAKAAPPDTTAGA